VLSQSNVRRVKAGVSIEQLAESIAQRTLLQSLSVRAVVDADGNETGMFEVPAGGRRYRALELLVKQKRMSKTQAVPCVVRDGPKQRRLRLVGPVGAAEALNGGVCFPTGFEQVMDAQSPIPRRQLGMIAAPCAACFREHQDIERIAEREAA
jgi:hypothetical protein